MKNKKRLAGIATALICTMNTLSVAVPTVSAEESSVLKFSYNHLDADGVYDYAIVSNCDESATEVVIPAEIDGLPVTGIGKKAFAECQALTSVTIPDTVTSIGDEAFRKCRALTSIDIPDSVTSIGDEAFLSSSITDVKLSDNIKHIGEKAFYGTPLSGNQVGMEYVGNWCIGCDSSVVNAEIREGTVGIVDNAFYRGKNVETITATNNLKYIGEKAFDATLFYQNTIGVKYVGNWVVGCSTDTVNAEIKEGTTDILFDSFKKCESLKSVTIPDGVTSIGDRAFEWCKSLEVISIPDSVTSIGKQCFSFCENLTSIKLPDNITKLNERTFSFCKSLAEITIPDSVTSIDGGTFVGCTSLKSITFPDNVERISPLLFTSSYTHYLYAEVCESLESIYVSENNENYKSVDGVLFNKDMTELVLCPYNYQAEEYIIPDTVTSIGLNAFSYNVNLKNITIPDSVTFITSSFYECSALESIVIPENVTTIKEGAFLCCPKLMSVTIENPDCEIEPLESHYGYDGTISNSIGWVGAEPDENGFAPAIAILEYYFDGVIYGHRDSTAQTFAETYKKNFCVIGETYVPPVTTTAPTTTVTTTTTVKTSTTAKPPQTIKVSGTTLIPSVTLTEVTTIKSPSTSLPIPGTIGVAFPVTTTDTKILVPTDATATKYGDSNLDNTINIADVVNLNKLILGKAQTQSDSTALANSDCVRDGVINIDDSALLLNFVSMTITEEEFSKK